MPQTALLIVMYLEAGMAKPDASKVFVFALFRQVWGQVWDRFGQVGAGFLQVGDRFGQVGAGFLSVRDRFGQVCIGFLLVCCCR